MRLRTRGRDGEHLARQIAPPTRIQLAALLEKVPVRLDFLPQHFHVLAAHRLGEDDRRLPLAFLVQREDRAHLVDHRLRRRMIHLVDGDHVGDLHDPRLQRLHRVAGAGHQNE